jgi:hypothetical protein
MYSIPMLVAILMKKTQSVIYRYCSQITLAPLIANKCAPIWMTGATPFDEAQRKLGLRVMQPMPNLGFYVTK